MTTPDTHYATLGVPEDASEHDIRLAYRALIRTLHPDLNKGNAERAKLVNAAYHTLTNPDLRADYDASLAQQRTTKPGTTKPGTTKPGTTNTGKATPPRPKRPTGPTPRDPITHPAIRIVAIVLVTALLAGFILTTLFLGDWQSAYRSRHDLHSTAFGSMLENLSTSTFWLLCLIAFGSGLFHGFTLALVILAPTAAICILLILGNASGSEAAATIFGSNIWVTALPILAAATIPLAAGYFAEYIWEALRHGTLHRTNPGLTSDTRTEYQRFLDQHPTERILYVRPHTPNASGTTTVTATDLGTKKTSRHELWLIPGQNSHQPWLIAVTIDGYETGRLDPKHFHH